MYVETVPNHNSPPAILLREAYREKKRLAAPKYFKSESHRSHNAPNLSAPWTTCEAAGGFSGRLRRRTN